MKTYFNKFLLCIMAIIIALSSVACVAVKNESYDDGGVNNNYAAENQGDDKGNEETVTPSFTEGDVNVYFYPQSGTGSQEKPFTHANSEGDSFIITVGDVEILVDGGNSPGACDAVKHNMRKYVSADKHWDYVIVTHADADHLGGFATTQQNKSIWGLFLSDLSGKDPEMTLGTIIDFDITNDDTVTDETFPKKEDLFKTRDPITGLVRNKRDYTNYTDYKNEVIKTGTKYYTSTQCCWKKRGLDKAPVEGATDRFSLDGDMITLNILYNYFSDHKFKTDTGVQPVDKNCISVCFSIDYVKPDGEVERFLFTGDLEEYSSNSAGTEYEYVGGETKLIENNPQLKEGVAFYKCAHHGSRTSSSVKFIDTIRPEVVVVPAIAGNNSYGHTPNSEHSFPELVVTDALFKYTDRIYIPAIAIYDDKDNKIGVADYYGEIMVGYSGDKIDVVTTASFDSKTGKPLPIQETEWFKTYRKTTINTFILSGYESANRAFLGNCTFVKYGHYDILIDCGIYSNESYTHIFSNVYVDKIKKYCVDDTIEYLIVSSPDSDSTQQLVDRSYGRNNNKGILSEFDVENIIDFGNVESPSGDAKNSLFKSYQEEKKSERCEYYDVAENIDKDFKIDDNLTIDLLANSNYGRKYNSDICVIINFKGKKMLFVGNNNAETLDKLAENKDEIAKNTFDNIVLFKLADHASSEAFSKKLLEKISSSGSSYNKKSGNPFYVVSSSIPGKDYPGKKIMTKAMCEYLYGITTSDNKGLYFGAVREDGIYKQSCGDIIFSISYCESGILADGVNSDDNNDLPKIAFNIQGTQKLESFFDTNIYKDILSGKVVEDEEVLIS